LAFIGESDGGPPPALPAWLARIMSIASGGRAATPVDAGVATAGVKPPPPPLRPLATDAAEPGVVPPAAAAAAAAAGVMPAECAGERLWRGVKPVVGLVVDR